MNIKIIHTPLWYGCDNPGTHLAPREFSRQNLPALAEKHGHSVKQISIIPTLPKPEDKFVQPTMKYLHEVTDCCKQLADAVDAGHRIHCFPLLIGGDHALGIGSIAGTARTIPAKDLSVIWIDAHTDINTDETSESHNIHGMPLAACLGLGDKRLFETMASPVPFLLPENLFYIGSRSIDPGEEEILKKYNIRAIRMEEIRQKGIEACCQELLDAVRAMGVKTVWVTLHVGIGTFRPVKVENIEEHHMHFEEYSVSDETAAKINETKAEGGRVICVGTTSLRTIESAAAFDEKAGRDLVKPQSSSTGIFIYPGYEFKVTDGLITNFHLPKSTLMMLVSALYDREEILKAYRTAVNERYRFFSYGDAMMII